MRRRNLQFAAAAAMALAAYPVGFAQAADLPTQAAPHNETLASAQTVTPPQQADMPPPPPQADMPPPPPQPPMMIMPPALVKHGPAPAGVAATVNGQKILSTNVKDLAYRWEGPNIVENILIPNLLIAQEAKKEGITVSKTEIDTRINDTRQQIAASGRGLTLEQALAQGHRTMADFRDNIKLRIAAEKMVLKTLPPVHFVHIRHILIATNTQNPGAPGQTPPHTDQEALTIIAKIQTELKAGASFEDLAKKYSEDPSNKAKGGDLGIVGPTTPFDPNFLKAALSLKKGEITPQPVKSYYGYHLIQCISTDTDHSPSEQLEYNTTITAFKGIEKVFNQQRLSQSVPALVAELKAKAKIVDYLSP